MQLRSKAVYMYVRASAKSQSLHVPPTGSGRVDIERAVLHCASTLQSPVPGRLFGRLQLVRVHSDNVVHDRCDSAGCAACRCQSDSAHKFSGVCAWMISHGFMPNR